MAPIGCIAKIALAALLVLSTGRLADALSSGNGTTCDSPHQSSGTSGAEISGCCWVQPGTNDSFTSCTNQHSKVFGDSIDGHTSGAGKIDLFWVCVCFLVVAGVPAATWMILIHIKCGWLVDAEVRHKQNNHITWNVTAISVFNMFESTAQATLQMYVGLVVFQNIKPELYPKQGLFNVATIWCTTWQSVVMLLLADFFNYFLHRLYHENKWLYRHLHSIHHEIRQVEHPVWSLFYVHPVELVFDNIAFMAGIHILQTTMFNVLVYGAISSIYSGAGHSGLLLPRWADKFLDTSFHQLHHSKLRCNYGEHFTLIDRLFGTYVAMPEEYKEERRKQQQLAAN